MQGYTDKERLGIALERFVHAVLKKTFPACDGFTIRTPDYQNYNNHNGADFRVFQRTREVLAFECKNWRKLRNKYGLDIAQSEIIDRFDHIGTNQKVLIISHSDTLTEPSLSAIRTNGIKIINISKLVGYKDFKTSLFAELLAKLTAIVKPRKGSSVQLDSSSSSKRLDCYVSNALDDTTKQTIPTSNSTPQEAPYRPVERFPDRRRFINEPRFNH